ncbi:hypothetical protein EKO04_004923 [Ascochyta lentis]|uniref:Uncharacterized protein n=1 Tax=Ascochyta lentis TaxID=205686 RepID=A0A8H7J835_9PLEO|nr:hypothetical protein EKO04_004923 [Ascochyta lentis]
MASTQGLVDLPRPKESVTFGLIVLAFFMPWLALYLDGASWPTIGINLATWFFLFPIGTLGAIVHAIVCLCRTDKHRKYSHPARRRLRYDNNYSARSKLPAEKDSLESLPSPAPVARAVTGLPSASVTRAVTAAPTPAERAPTEPPAPLQRAITEPPAVKSSATSSSTSLSSSDVEKEHPPATAPLPKDNPFKDPDA